MTRRPRSSTVTSPTGNKKQRTHKSDSDEGSLNEPPSNNTPPPPPPPQTDGDANVQIDLTVDDSDQEDLLVDDSDSDALAVADSDGHEQDAADSEKDELAVADSDEADDSEAGDESGNSDIEVLSGALRPRIPRSTLETVSRATDVAAATATMHPIPPTGSAPAGGEKGKAKAVAPPPPPPPPLPPLSGPPPPLNVPVKPPAPVHSPGIPATHKQRPTLTFAPRAPRPARPHPSTYTVNALAYTELGRIENDIVGPADWDSLTHGSFGEWLHSVAVPVAQDRIHEDTVGLRPSEGLCLSLGVDKLAADAANLLHLAQMSDKARDRAHALEHTRALAISLIETPFVSQAVAMQDRKVDVQWKRESYFSGSRRGWEQGYKAGAEYASAMKVDGSLSTASGVATGSVVAITPATAGASISALQPVAGPSNASTSTMPV